jgi:hypothetical protein
MDYTNENDLNIGHSVLSRGFAYENSNRILYFIVTKTLTSKNLISSRTTKFSTCIVFLRRIARPIDDSLKLYAILTY